ncbi:hypothetical protein [Haloquadratum walsbyi]|jgi:hypothetical protein|uniref:Major facilitator superfamily (MFS) profile domain-containing protein n=1 Tax=Haloquadratum walsbyi J07HQW2 TaxID=1238425 RepID=U1NI18_9EURY|nr:hypothetical protein [Haloquadratum walsbyi]ERG96533.1 MAG: hypothetical protein J07HQW2_03013 [Haloquadratum walsbyi J07HQW2]
MKFNRGITGGALIGIVGLGTAALILTEMMPAQIILMMVTPSMLVFGLLCLVIGVKHGEYRTATR